MSGEQAKAATQPCPRCDGSGRVFLRAHPAPDLPCPDCNGYGYHGHTNPELGDRCSTCNGVGLTSGSFQGDRP